jgi:hypothetical protein
VLWPRIFDTVTRSTPASTILEATYIISRNPQALQLSFLGTLTEIAAEKNSTIIFPLPLELLRAFTYNTTQEKK